MLAYNYSFDEKFSVTFNKCSRPVQAWNDEVNLTAKAIAKSTDKPLVVLMSGGIDSEMVARAFLDNDIKFTALTLKHTQGTNVHDTNWADSFCKKYNIRQEVLDFDTSQFDNIIEKYIEQGYRSTNIYHYMQLYILEYLESLGVFGVGGAGEQIYYTIDGVVHLKVNPSYTLGRQWCSRNNTWHQLWFSLDNPEIYASYMQIDVIDCLLKNPNYFINHHFASVEKMLVLHNKWPDMQRRNKFSGFENLRVHYRNPKEAELKNRFPDLIDLCIPVITAKNQLGIL
jgi:hypothetical protein